jgi:hypothetical protein
MVPRFVSALLVFTSAITVFVFPQIADRPLGLPEQLNAAIIGLSALPRDRTHAGDRARSASPAGICGPAVAWPIMAAGIVSLIIL